jgi:hypothetical protein
MGGIKTSGVETFHEMSLINYNPKLYLLVIQKFMNHKNVILVFFMSWPLSMSLHICVPIDT